MNTTVREHRWTLAEAPDPARVGALAREINVPEAIARILVQRGIDDYDRAKAFFRPTLDLLHDPFLLDGMEVATRRTMDALTRGEKVLVFGDYDVDGTNGAAMLFLFLREIGAQVTYYIPDRIKEGYGISRTGMDSAHARGVTLFIAVDCGITAVEQVEYARSLGMDVIICDHHEPGSSLPAACALLDPLKPGDGYPFKHLAGCGVGFKFLHGLARRLGRENLLGSYLDFVTLASTADIVPLVGENRVLVRQGLAVLNGAPRPGIRALAERAGLRIGEITSGNIVFVLAPRINAVGRLGDASRAVELLVCDDPEKAGALAQVLEDENRNRRLIDEMTFAQASELAETMPNRETDSALVLHQEDWHPGVIGIVASRMVERYYKPSVMLATVDGVAKGSARSVSGFDIYRALQRCEDKLIQFGGHKYAAGLTLEVSRLEEFREAFNAAVRELMTDELRNPEIRIDTELKLSEVTPRFVRILNEFAPFGPGNMRPVFLARDLEVMGTPRIVGKNHLRFRVRQNGRVFDAIGFGCGELLPRVPPGRRDLSCVFSLEESRGSGAGPPREGEAAAQIKIRDLR
ncbi:MAG: single-stranded-DNA-specific exonuclease RecJ [Bacteroidota bacterium]